ncbi:MAG: SPFH domain-containing protein [Dorea sp.]|nr:SPFH domain-containing protein [Dorea sp.]
MGLIKALSTATGSVMRDQWKEFFYCDSMDSDVLMVRGKKRVSKGSSNKGNDNIITKGSGIAVADGQAMIIVDQGRVVEFCAEPGEFTYDSSSEPSIFTGSLGKGIKDTFKQIGKRFTYGGETAKDQRVYYINTKELMGNKFGTPTPIPFRVVDRRANMDIDVSIRCNGTYVYTIADPLLFYTKIASNVTTQYDRSQLDSTLKTEFIDALQPGLGALSNLEIRPNQIVAHNMELKKAMNEALADVWGKRGLEITNIAIGSITLTEEDQKMLQEAQRTASLQNSLQAGATLVQAQADAMKAAASNASGAMTGFMGMGMAAQAGGVNPQNLYAMGQQQAAATPAPSKDSWTCACGTVNTGKFCAECGAKKPEAETWTCTCGTVNTGKFCSECGAKKPSKTVCPKCGFVVESGKFCPECGTQL